MNTANTLRKGDAVIVFGREHTVTWGPDGDKQYGRVIDADTIGADLNRATAVVTRTVRFDADEPA